MFEPVSEQPDEIAKLHQTIHELQVEVRLLQEAVGSLLAMVDDEDLGDDRWFAGGESGGPAFRINMGM